MLTKELELLKDILINKTPILVLGAGFSIGALNHKNNPLPNSNALAKELYTEILTKNLSPDKLKDLPLGEKYSLKEICDIISTLKLTGARNNYLIERFKGCKCEKDDYHMLLKNYKWSTIFTFNIDDFVEFIYDNQINVQNFKKTRQVSYPILSKLHGSVNEPLSGFVFSSDEYRDNLINDNWCNYTFGMDYCRTDVIFLGTEFQEEDILCVLQKFESLLEVTKNLKYFFITPTLNNWELKTRISQNSNYYHINFTTEQFLKFLDKEVTVTNSARKKMRDFGAVFVDEENKDTIYSYKNIGSLYQGDYPRIRDILDNWDIEYPNYQEWHKSIDINNNQLICIYGEPYVGKSCISLRFLVDAFNEGYHSFIFSMRSDLDKHKYLTILEDYLSTLPNGTKCCILAENMAIYYETILDILRKCPKNLKQLNFIVTSNELDHQSKQYLIDDYKYVHKFKVTYKLNKNFAENIYYKLSEKNHLNKLSLYCDKKLAFIKYILSINDIIEVLYIAQEGRKFNEYFSSCLASPRSVINKQIFKILFFLNELNLNTIQINIFSDILSRLGIKLNYKDFLSEYKDVVKCNNNELQIRCFRIIKKIFKEHLSLDEKQQIIFTIANMLAPNLLDREESPQSEMYQKIIKVKHLAELNILSNNKLLECLISLETTSSNLSYYWIQRGIANRNINNFEEANNSFEKAISVRGHSSYHIQHAQAKNYLAWGIWAIKKGKIDQKSFFLKGKDMLNELITNSNNRYFGYSIHTYTDMILNYYFLTGEEVDIKELIFIKQGLTQLIKKDDQYGKTIVKRFNNFCKEREIPISIDDVKIIDSENNYDIDEL